MLRHRVIPRLKLEFTMLYDDLNPKLRTNLINLDQTVGDYTQELDDLKKVNDHLEKKKMAPPDSLLG